MTSRAHGQNNVRSTTGLIEPPPPPPGLGLPLLGRVLLSEACVVTDGRDPWKSISDWRGIEFHLATGNDAVPLAILGQSKRSGRLEKDVPCRGWGHEMCHGSVIALSRQFPLSTHQSRLKSTSFEVTCTRQWHSTETVQCITTIRMHSFQFKPVSTVVTTAHQ